MQRTQTEELVAAKDKKENCLFNKVIKLQGEALEENDYTYWLVVTYIPHFEWCHLAPMIQEGQFGPERKKLQGRPRYRLLDDTLRKDELDISSMYCIPVQSQALHRTVQAEKKEWDIMDGPVCPTIK